MKDILIGRNLPRAMASDWVSCISAMRSWSRWSTRGLRPSIAAFLKMKGRKVARSSWSLASNRRWRSRQSGFEIARCGKWQ